MSLLVDLSTNSMGLLVDLSTNSMGFFVVQQVTLAPYFDQQENSCYGTYINK